MSLLMMTSICFQMNTGGPAWVACLTYANPDDFRRGLELGSSHARCWKGMRWEQLHPTHWIDNGRGATSLK